MIPQNYQQWRHCIVNECRIELTPLYIQQRLQVLNDKSHQETKRLTFLYGKTHLEKLITWFNAAACEALTAAPGKAAPGFH
ncbi:hypothetical protein [Candidatus Pantoea soli]|uniref:hypothetical protein n=1 Tax=Candidatus Pantoea soli TaxID=3098669 RepID=UPI0016482B8B|nr:hypothetical protein [Pantoea soli]